MKTHTPGPWRWHQRDKSCNGELLLVHPHQGFLVVMDFARHGMQGGQPRFATWKNDERENMGGLMKPAAELDVPMHPDAALIAAAPALLDALKRSLEDFQCSQKSDGPHPGCPCRYCYGWAAIALAEPHHEVRNLHRHVPDRPPVHGDGRRPLQ